jgi:hypothetical protein
MRRAAPIRKDGHLVASVVTVELDPAKPVDGWASQSGKTYGAQLAQLIPGQVSDLALDKGPKIRALIAERVAGSQVRSAIEFQILELSS